MIAAPTVSTTMAERRRAPAPGRVRPEDVLDPLLLREIERLPAHDRLVRLSAASSGAPTASVQGLPLCSAVDPREQAERWAQSLGGFENPPHLVVVFGLVLGEHLKALRKRTAAPILVVEPCIELIRRAVEHGLLAVPSLRVVHTPAAARRYLARGMDLEQRIALFAWPISRRIFGQQYKETVEAVRRAASLAAVTQHTLERRLHRWADNLIDNLSCCGHAVGAQHLRTPMQGRSVFIVAAGPSLDRNIDQLRRVGDRAVVIAVNTAVGALERAGVRADLIVAVELLDVREQFDGLRLNAQVPRALSLTAHPELFRSAPAEVFPFGDHLHFFKPMADAAGVVCGFGGGSVANAAFALARSARPKRIVMVGQDLAYTNGLAYAGGTIFDQIRVDVRGDWAVLEHLAAKRRIGGTCPGLDTTVVEPGVEQVPAWGGRGTVATTLPFNYFRYVFESWAAGIEDKIELINATEGGASIGGFAERALSEVVDRLPRTASRVVWPREPKMSAESILAAFADERARVLAALGEARSAAELATPQAMMRLRNAVHASGLLSAYSWEALGAVARDDNADLQTLCSHLTAAAEHCAEKLDCASRKLVKIGAKLAL